MQIWHLPDTAPKDGREIIVWTSSRKGFADCTALIDWFEDHWIWACSGDKFLGEIHGWMPWPEPTQGFRPDGTKAWTVEDANAQVKENK